MLLVVSHNRSFLNDVCTEIGIIAHQRLAVFRGTFKDSWTAAKMAEFLAVGKKVEYKVHRVVRDWEKRVTYRQGDGSRSWGRRTKGSCARCGGPGGGGAGG